MNLADPDLALEKAREFLSIVETDRDNYPHYRYTGNVMAKLRGMLPLMRDIAAGIHPEIAADFQEPTDLEYDYSDILMWRWNAAKSAAETLVASSNIEASANEYSDRKVPPWMPPDCTSGCGTPRGGAGTTDTTETRYTRPPKWWSKKPRSTSVSTCARLYGEAFSTKDPEPDNPRLRLTFVDKEDKDTWLSAHEGAMHLGMACAKGIRNPLAHGRPTSVNKRR